MARVLIAGCGDVGTTLALRLAGAGAEVFGLRRRAGALPAPIRALAADLADPATLRDLPRALEAVCYLAAAGGRDDAAYRSAYVDGLRNLLHALARDGATPARLVYVSSTSVYGQADGEWVDEESVTRPASFTGERLLEGESLAAGFDGLATVVRFAGIYGPGRGRLIERVRGGAGCAAGLWTNRIHRDDCAGALAHLLALERPARCYVGADSTPARQCEVMDWLAARAGVPPPPRLEPSAARGRGKRCANARLLASGYTLRHPGFRDGYGPLLDRGPGDGGDVA